MATTKQKGKEDAPVVVGALPSALNRLEKLLGAGASTVTIAPIKDKTLLSVQSQGAVSEALLPKLLPGLASAWDFPFPTLAAALLKRDSAQFTFSDGQLNIKDKNYTSALQGVEAASVMRVEKPSEPKCSIEMKPELWSMLEEMTGKIKIGKSLAALPDITVHFHFTKKLAMAVAFDRSRWLRMLCPTRSVHLSRSHYRSLWQKHCSRTAWV